MKVEEEIRLIRQFNVPSGTHVVSSSISVADKDIHELIDKLNKIKVRIDVKRSKKTLADICEDEQDGYSQADVPLNYGPDKYENTGVVSYMLRGDQLEIDLKNRFCKLTQNRGIIGGMLAFEEGILGSIRFEGTYEEGEIVPKIKQTIEDFYKTLFEIKLKDIPKVRVVKVSP